MAKYDPLRRYLRRRNADVRLSFADLERIINALLPHAAEDPAWWTNDPPTGRGFVQCRAWLEAGYRAEPASPLEAVLFRAVRTPAESHDETAGERDPAD